MDTQNSKSIYPIILIFLIGLAVVFYIWNQNKKPEVREEKPKTEQKREVEYLGAESLPPGLPEDLPMEGSLGIKRNEVVNLTLPSGKTESQFVRSFYSEKTVAENLETYKDYVLGKGWQSTTEITDGKNFAIFTAYDAVEKKRYKFEFAYNENTEDNTVTVTLIK